MQTRRSSVVEACFNTASGFVISITFTIAYHLFFGATVGNDLGLVCSLTVVSVVRSYFWRRTFNWWHAR